MFSPSLKREPAEDGILTTRNEPMPLRTKEPKPQRVLKVPVQQRLADKQVGVILSWAYEPLIRLAGGAARNATHDGVHHLGRWPIQDAGPLTAQTRILSAR